MSTIPGSEAWRDAGLVPVDPEEPRRLGDEETAPDEPEAEEYAPAFPRADRAGQANEADVVEQDTEVPVDDDEDDDA
mgnify:CR=1 FL=1